MKAIDGFHIWQVWLCYVKFFAVEWQCAVDYSALVFLKKEQVQHISVYDFSKSNIYFLCISSPISLTVAKCWDPSPRSYFTIPRGKTDSVV